MSDLITRARKEWVEPRVEDALDCTLVFHRPPERCPPEVVAALLDVLRASSEASHGRRRRDESCAECLAVDTAETAIAKALEGEL